MARSDASFRALGSLMMEHRLLFTVSTIVRVASAMLPALHPYFVAQLATSGGEDVGRNLLLLFGTGVAHMVLWTWCDWYTSKYVTPLHWEFKQRAFDAIWSEPYPRFVDRPSGKVASYVNDLRAHVASLWDTAHYGFLPVLATIPVYVVLFWQTAAGNAVGYVVFLMLAAVVLTKLSKPLARRQRTLTDHTSDNTGRVFDSYANFVNVFSFRSHAKERRRNDEQMVQLKDDDVRFNIALTAYWGGASVLVRVMLWGAVMAFSWWQFDRGAISLTAMVVSITVLLDFTTMYWNIAHFLGEWIDKSASLREAYGYLFGTRNFIAAPPPAMPSSDWHTRPRATQPSEETPLLEVRNLSFAYPDEPSRLVLDDVSFRLGQTERLGVVGRSGEGKSTLIKILLGFYEPTSGEILLHGEPATAVELAAIQSYVPQDTSLFQETIEYNIGYAEPGPVDHAAIREAATRANISDFVESLSMGYRTMVGERGIKLSLGQRQRIAIARAFVRSSDLVILDEATSALDSETEAKIHESLTELWADRAAIVIAHRLATLNDMDRIMVIEQGRVAEHGTRDQLLDNAGRFADLWGLQRAALN